MTTHTQANLPPKSRLKDLQTAVRLLLVLTCGATCSLPAMAKGSNNDPFKGVKPPTSQWQLHKVKQGEIEVGIKGKMKAINIGLRIQEEVPIPAADFLDQVRSKIMADPAYQGAEVSLVHSQMAGGKNWDFFVIKRKDQINQEFWARPLSSDKILNVLYTAVGNYYEQYREDFLKVLTQAAGD